MIDITFFVSWLLGASVSIAYVQMRGYYDEMDGISEYFFYTWTIMVMWIVLIPILVINELKGENYGNNREN